MCSGERPIGAAKGKQSDTEALCQPPPPKRPSRGEGTPVPYCPGALWGGGVCHTEGRDVGLHPLQRRLLVQEAEVDVGGPELRVGDEEGEEAQAVLRGDHDGVHPRGELEAGVVPGRACGRGKGVGEVGLGGRRRGGEGYAGSVV